MKKFTLLFVLTCILIGLAGSLNSQNRASTCSSCDVAQQALDELQHVKVGMTRKQLEQTNFILAGGMLFRGHTNYMYRNCQYLNVDVDFSLDPAVEREFSPNDTITKISRLYVIYPPRD